MTGSIPVIPSTVSKGFRGIERPTPTSRPTLSEVTPNIRGMTMVTSREELAEEALRSACPQPCEHLSQHDAREGKTCPEHPCACPKPAVLA
jgi:hypothetical protein